MPAWMAMLTVQQAAAMAVMTQRPALRRHSCSWLPCAGSCGRRASAQQSWSSKWQRMMLQQSHLG